MRCMVFLIALLCANVGTGGSTDPLTFVGHQQDLFIDDVLDIALSPDNGQVYAASYESNSISVFERNPASGEMTWRSVIQAADHAPEILVDPTSLAISPDGGHAYVTTPFGLSVFNRDSNGDLTFLEVHRDDEGGLTSLLHPNGVVVSPDNRHVYVTAFSDDSLSVFDRDPTTGELSFLEAHLDSDPGVNGLGEPASMAMSPGGESIYVTSDSDDSVAVFNRDSVTGRLTYFHQYRDSDFEITGLLAPDDVVVSSDGTNVYVASSISNRIAIFERSTINGLLTFLEGTYDGSGSERIAISPDGKHLYAIETSGSSLKIYARNPANGTLSQLLSDEILKPRSVNLSGDGAMVIVGTKHTGITAFARNPSTGSLNQIDHEPSAPGLGGAVGITAASNPCVYVAGPTNHSVQVLTQVSPGGSPAVTGDVNLGNSGITGPRSVATSRSKRHVYVASHDSSEITRVAYTSSSPCSIETPDLVSYGDGSGGIHGLDGPQHLALSPDEAYLFVASQNSDSLAVFKRDTETGDLSFRGAAYDDDGLTDGLDGAYWVDMTPDGSWVYVAGYIDDAIAVFFFDPFTESLIFSRVTRDGDGIVDGLDGVSSIALSPDGRHAYAAGRHDDSVAMFALSPTVGALIYLGRLQDGVDGVDGLDGARAVAVSPDGRQVYVASQFDDALAVFSRNSVNGVLTYVGVHKDGVAGVDGLDTANGVAVSPDGMQIYVTGYGDNAVATFYRSDVIIFSDGFESGNTSEWSSTTGLP